MLLEKSVLDYMQLAELVDTQLVILDMATFDFDQAVMLMLDSDCKFVMITHQSSCAILSAYDLLSMEMKHQDVLDYVQMKHKLIGPISDDLTLGDFLTQNENSPYRYYGIKNRQGIYGFVDKKAIIALYRQIDEDNNALITSILDNIDDAICIVDTEFRVKYWNKQAEKLYGLSRNVILDQVLTEYFPNALLPQVVKSQKRLVNVYNLPRENAHNLTSASPLYNRGVLIGGISYDKDISEQIRIAESLKEKETNLDILQKELKQIGEHRFGFDNMVGEDPGWLEVIKITKMVSKSMLNILISGESGTGKEVLARAIHLESMRKGYFVPINCSAIPKDLFESELFGYASGAFTGASSKGKIGKFEFASGGTLFLDEIGDMPMAMQAKLLRVLEDGEVTPVGGNKSIKIDVRVIAASNKDLMQLSNEGLFRKDLYYRLNGIGVHLTPLRERPGDIKLFAEKFFQDFKETYGYPRLMMPDEIMEMLQAYHWEGNIRELKNIIERTVILSKNNGLLEVSDQFLPDVIRNMAIRMKVGPSYSLNDLIEQTEIEAITAALTKAKNKADAAKLLKIPRSTLYFKMDKYHIKHVSEN